MGNFRSSKVGPRLYLEECKRKFGLEHFLGLFLPFLFLPADQ